jgi:hypothetical protein
MIFNIIFGLRTEELRRDCRKYVIRSFIICIHHEIVLGRSNLGGEGRGGVTFS